MAAWKFAVATSGSGIVVSDGGERLEAVESSLSVPQARVIKVQHAELIARRLPLPVTRWRTNAGNPCAAKKHHAGAEKSIYLPLRIQGLPISSRTQLRATTRRCHVVSPGVCSWAKSADHAIVLCVE
jgi:hypothetical protein